MKKVIAATKKVLGFTAALAIATLTIANMGLVLVGAMPVWGLAALGAVGIGLGVAFIKG